MTRMNDTDTEGIHYGPPVRGEMGRGDESEKRKEGEMRREVVGKP